jgi:hypothetical protein
MLLCASFVIRPTLFILAISNNNSSNNNHYHYHYHCHRAPHELQLLASGKPTHPRSNVHCRCIINSAAGSCLLHSLPHSRAVVVALQQEVLYLCISHVIHMLLRRWSCDSCSHCVVFVVLLLLSIATTSATTSDAPQQLRKLSGFTFNNIDAYESDSTSTSTPPIDNNIQQQQVVSVVILVEKRLAQLRYAIEHLAQALDTYRSLACHNNNNNNNNNASTSTSSQHPPTRDTCNNNNVLAVQLILVDALNPQVDDQIAHRHALRSMIRVLGNCHADCGLWSTPSIDEHSTLGQFDHVLWLSRQRMEREYREQYPQQQNICSALNDTSQRHECLDEQQHVGRTARSTSWLLNRALPHAYGQHLLVLNMYLEVDAMFLVELLAPVVHKQQRDAQAAASHDNGGDSASDTDNSTQDTDGTSSIAAVGCLGVTAKNTIHDAGISFIMTAKPPDADTTLSGSRFYAAAMPQHAHAFRTPMSIPQMLDVPQPLFQYQGEQRHYGAAVRQQTVMALSGMCVLFDRHILQHQLLGFDERFRSTPSSATAAAVYTHMAVIDACLRASLMHRHRIVLQSSATAIFTDPLIDSPVTFIELILAPWRRDDLRIVAGDNEKNDAYVFGTLWAAPLTRQIQARYQVNSLAVVWDMECGLGQGLFMYMCQSVSLCLSLSLCVCVCVCC